MQVYPKVLSYTQGIQVLGDYLTPVISASTQIVDLSIMMHEVRSVGLYKETAGGEPWMEQYDYTTIAIRSPVTCQGIR